MAEYVTKEQVIDWYRPYGQTDEPIPFETLVSDLRDMKAADVAPVRHEKWLHIHQAVVDTTGDCSACDTEAVWRTRNKPYGICPNCGAKMDLEG